MAVGLDGLLELVEGGLEILDFSELQGEGHGIAGCPEAEGWVGALHNFCEDGETAWQRRAWACWRARSADSWR